MATITPRTDKDGKITSYLIRVYHGYDQNGKRLKPYTLTWKPDSKMTARQVEKELKRQEIQFEEQCKLGYALDNRQTFAEYAEYVLTTKEGSGTKHRTIERYRELLERINAGIGHIKIADIRPQHLNQLYSQLRQNDIRENSSTASARKELVKVFEKTGLLKKELAEKAGLSSSSTRNAFKGVSVSFATASGISKALGKPIDTLFDVVRVCRPLSEKTIQEHHRLISLILGQAEKEMLILYNPATKVINAPKRERSHAANYFEPAELEKIRDCLQKEPLKWQVITHLLIVTGCRRGEIMGLKWSAVDLDNKKLYIRNNLLYAKDFGYIKIQLKRKLQPEQFPFLMKQLHCLENTVIGGLNYV